MNFGVTAHFPCSTNLTSPRASRPFVFNGVSLWFIGQFCRCVSTIAGGTIIFGFSFDFSHYKNKKLRSGWESGDVVKDKRLKLATWEAQLQDRYREKKAGEMCNSNRLANNCV